MKFVSKVLRRQGRWTRNLVLLLSALVPIFLVLYGLRVSLNDPKLSAEWKIGLLATTALVFLICSGFSLGLLLNRNPLPFIKANPSHPFFRMLVWWRNRDRFADIFLAACISLAYLVPIILFQLPVWLRMGRLNIPASQWFTSLGADSGMPWFFIWQVICIAIYPIAIQIYKTKTRISLMIDDHTSQKNITRSSKTLPGIDFKIEVNLPWYFVAAGLLAGTGIALAAIFIFSIETAGSKIDIGNLSSLHQIILVIVALCIAPWAEELTFRGQIKSYWISKFGSFWPALGCATVYATLLLRPLFWIPAFCLSLGLSELTRHTRSLVPAILAHMIINAIVLIFGWWMVL